MERQRWEQALADFDAVLKVQPKDYNALAERALLLATCPDDKIRDGERALTDAKQALALQKWHNTASALAAAYAESGDFDRAASAQEEAIQLAKQSGPALVPEFEKRLELYRAKMPYRSQGTPGK